MNMKNKKNTEPTCLRLDLNALRKAYGGKLKEHQQNQIEMIIFNFAHMAYKKYAAGAKEHKNNLSKEVAMKELMAEAIDMFVYAMVANS